MSIAPVDATTPPSSSPLEIYRALHEDVVRGDRHSSGIAQNKVGLRRGAISKKDRANIDPAALETILAVVEQAQLRDFRPLLYVIPFAPVAGDVLDVPVSERAHVMSDEYRIEPLERRSFDIIEFPVLRG